MKRAFIMACGLAVALVGCTGRSKVETRSGADDKPFGTYQSGVDRAKEVQQQAGQRVSTQDSAAAAARDGGQ